MPADEQAATEQEKAGEDAAGQEAPEKEAVEDPAKKLEEWKKNRDEIIKENDRQQKEYDQALVDARKRVDELNERFGRWFYVINEDTYHKIHLSRDEIIKKKEKSKDEKTDDGSTGTEDKPKDGLEAFDQIKKSVEAPSGNGQ